MTDDRYVSPLGSRYASPDMQRLWGPRHRIGVWRRLWLALAEAQQEMGLDIPDSALEIGVGPPRGHTVGGDPVPMGLVILSIGPCLHRRVHENVGMIVLQNAVKPSATTPF